MEKNNVITDLICSLIPVPSTSSLKISSIAPSNLVIPKNKHIKKQQGVLDGIYSALRNFFNCDAPAPPSDFCITDDDCDDGENCKQGSCILDQLNCINSGCDENHECNEETGICEFIPECESNADCDSISTGEVCISRICKPPVCFDDLFCPSEWKCVDKECEPVDCTIVNGSNLTSCCFREDGFQRNSVACCDFQPSDPRCT